MSKNSAYRLARPLRRTSHHQLFARFRDGHVVGHHIEEQAHVRLLEGRVEPAEPGVTAERLAHAGRVHDVVPVRAVRGSPA